MKLKDKKISEDKFLKELQKRGKLIKNYLLSHHFRSLFRPKDIFEGVYSYPTSMGKALRPSILLFSCGAARGEEEKAIPAAAAVEMYHTWTLVHDDIIDNDDLRRGKPTVHKQFYSVAKERGYSEKESLDYGKNIAILVGDIQHAWSISLFTDLYSKYNFDPALVLKLINELEKRVSPLLIEGETLDIQYEKKEISELSKEQIIDMSAKKTGELYSYSAKIGAMIGLKEANENHPLVKALSGFCFNCGVAFQLQDDILGLVSEESKFGKPIGSDIREGKRTTIVWYAYKRANLKEKNQLVKLVGNKKATKEEILEAINLLTYLNGIKETEKLALSYIRRAKKYLKVIPDSPYKDLLETWADFMIERKF